MLSSSQPLNPWSEEEEEKTIHSQKRLLKARTLQVPLTAGDRLEERQSVDPSHKTVMTRSITENSVDRIMSFNDNNLLKKGRSPRNPLTLFGRNGCSISEADGNRSPACTPKALTTIPWYDEASLGWNEIFDLEDPHGPIDAFGSARAPPALQMPEVIQPVPLAERARGGRRLHHRGPDREAPSFSPRLEDGLTLGSKCLPDYLKVPSSGKRSFMMRGLQEHILKTPVHVARQPAKVMEGELQHLRLSLIQQRHLLKKERRVVRRLNRRCRVLPHEDVEVLAKQYIESGILVPLPPPPDISTHTARKTHRPLSERTAWPWKASESP